MVGALSTTWPALVALVGELQFGKRIRKDIIFRY